MVKTQRFILSRMILYQPVKLWGNGESLKKMSLNISTILPSLMFITTKIRKDIWHFSARCFSSFFYAVCFRKPVYIRPLLSGWACFGLSLRYLAHSPFLHMHKGSVPFFVMWVMQSDLMPMAPCLPYPHGKAPYLCPSLFPAASWLCGALACL